MVRKLWLIAGLSTWLLIASCTTVHVQRAPSTLNHQATWALLPVVNHTQTPQAGLRAESILETLVRSRGVFDLHKYPTEINSESLFEPAERAAVDRGLSWARNLEADYAITGSVDEWRYKVGVDGEPAVGISLQLIEMRTGRVIWTAVGSKTGWSREALSAVAQKLISRLTQPLTAGAGNSESAARTVPPKKTVTKQPGSPRVSLDPDRDYPPARPAAAMGMPASSTLPAEDVSKNTTPAPRERTRLPFPLREPTAGQSGV